MVKIQLRANISPLQASRPAMEPTEQIRANTLINHMDTFTFPQR